MLAAQQVHGKRDRLPRTVALRLAGSALISDLSGGTGRQIARERDGSIVRVQRIVQPAQLGQTIDLNRLCPRLNVLPGKCVWAGRAVADADILHGCRGGLSGVSEQQA